MSLKIDEQMKNNLSEMLSDVAVKLESGEDFRKCLAQLRPICAKFTASMNLTEDTNTAFASYLVLRQLMNVSHAYEGGNESWYESNSQNIESFRRCLSLYLKRLAKDIYSENYNTLIENTKNFFSEFNKHAKFTNLKGNYQ
jgi:hypothetical protein